MKPVHALTILVVMAATPLAAQETPPSAVIPGTEDQAVERPLMARVQQQLKQDGYYQGQVDGFYGGQTRQALARWQRDQGISATGQLNLETLTAMDVIADTQRAEVPERTREGGEETPRPY